MIYQLYPNTTSQDRLFRSSLYRGFGLNPEVNSAIFRNCPELENPRWRLSLAEYVAMLYLWRNPPDDGHSWIGFTSYRQTDKTGFQLLPEDGRTVNALLEEFDVLGWGFLEHEMSVIKHAEYCHPGFTRCFNRVLASGGCSIPASMESDRVALFCNYWILDKGRFDQYMTWSWPLVHWMLFNLDNDDYLRSSGSDHFGPLGSIMERLFIAWYSMDHKRLYDLVRERPVRSRLKASDSLALSRGMPTLGLAAALFLMLDQGGHRIVELGSMRRPLGDGQSLCDGRSTLLWGLSGAEVFSVDIDPAASQESRRATAGLSNVHIVTQDAEAFLEDFEGPIDLLYLDAWDIGTPDYQGNHLRAYQRARPLLHAKSLILIDDTDLQDGGKGALVVPAAVGDGFRTLLTGRQTLLAGPGILPN